MSPEAFPVKLREEALRLRRYGAEAQATLLSTVADDLEAAFREQREELLNLQEAAAASGYSARQLSRLAASGALPLYGRRSAPRFRRGDLPRKASAPQSTGPNTTPRGITKEQIAQSIVNRKR